MPLGEFILNLSNLSKIHSLSATVELIVNRLSVLKFGKISISQ